MSTPAPWATPADAGAPPPVPWWQGPPPPGPSRPRPRRSHLALGAAALALALAGGVTAVVQQDPATGAVSADAEVAAALPGLQEFVEAERGLPFLREVEVEVLDDDAFVEALFSGPAPTKAEEAAYEGDTATLLALGLLGDEDELDEALGEDGADAVLGFYDTETEQLVVRGTALTPLARMTLVHELTHAVQDQHFELFRPELETAEDERGLAFAALVEGDATRVEEAWYDAQPDEVRDGVDDELDELYGDYESTSFVADVLTGFPYVVGAEYARALVDDGGQARLDAAFAAPPTTTEEVFAPGSPAPVAVPLPAAPAGAEVVDQGVLGELGLGLLLDTDPFGEGPNTAWRGDGYVTWEADDETCTALSVVTASAQERDDLLDELRELYDDVAPAGADGLSLTSCA